MVKNLPDTQETWVQSLCREDPLEKEMAMHSSIFAWKIVMDRGAWWARVHGVTKSQTRLSDFTQTALYLLSPTFPPLSTVPTGNH